MKIKDLKINFRYLCGNIACLSVDSIDGESVHNDIENEEAIIIFNSLVGEKENCQTVKTLLKENQELKKQLEDINNFITKCGFVNVEQLALAYIGLQEQLEEWKELLNKFKIQQKEFIKYLEDMLDDENDIFSVVRVKDVLQKYNEMKWR